MRPGLADCPARRPGTGWAVHLDTTRHDGCAGNGGGIDAVNAVTLKNTIVSANTAASGTDVSGTITSNNYNLIGTLNADLS